MRALRRAADAARHDRRRDSFLTAAFAAALLGLSLGTTGCLGPQVRSQSAEEPDRSEKEAVVKTIGESTSVANVDPIPVSGVGLVVGLDGTGGDPPPGGFRQMLEEQLRKQGCEQPKELLASPNTSMVLVSGLIPAGAKRGDPIDLEITLPPQSHTTSLRGGILSECVLYDYDSAKSVAPNFAKSDGFLKGHILARGKGPVQVGQGDGDEETRLTHGKVWGGGKCTTDRPVYLVLENDEKHQASARMAQAIAARINETFHGPYRGALAEMASAKSDTIVMLTVPHQYRLNIPRYLRVVRLIPVRDDVRQAYRRKLKEDVTDPTKTITAALRLEALGAGSTDDLKAGLQSDHVLVRFACAEALAYLGSPSGGDELANLVEDNMALRAFSLTALASLDEAVCHVKLRELLASARPETRYGAFRALRALDEHEAGVQGELLNESFWLHRVAEQSPPLVHVSTSRRAEIILFGQDVHLIPPFSILAGPEFTVTAGQDDDRCTVSRFSPKHGDKRRQCSLKLEDVIRTLADIGGTYPDAVELLKQAGSCRSMTTQLAVDALPQATSVHELARVAADDPDLKSRNAELLASKGELGATPTLFEREPVRSASLAGVDPGEDRRSK